MKSNSIIKTAGFMAFVTLLAKGCGLIRDSLIAAHFSTGIAADAFMTASKLPTTLFDMVVGGVISASFIPVFSYAAENQGRDKAKIFADKFITLVFTISCVIAVFGIIFAPFLVGLLAPMFSGEKQALTVQLTRIMFPMIIFTGLAFSFVGVLQSNGEYRIPSLISLVSNLAIIAYFITLGNKFGINGLAYTMLIAWALQVAVQIPSLLRFKFIPRLNFKFFDENVKRAMLLAGPMLVSTWVQPLYSIVNSRLASGIPGAVSTLEYANRLYTMLVGVFSFVVTNLVFPKLAGANARGNREESNILMVNSVKSICIVILPLMALFIILAPSVTSIIYEHNNFNAEDAAAVSLALRCYSVGMIGLALNEVLSKIFFSMENSKTPMINSVTSMVFNIIAAYVLFRYFKTAGLALAAAGGSIFNAVLNGICLRRKTGGLLKRADYADILKAVFWSAVSGAAAFAAYMLLGKYIYGSFTANCLITVICGLIGAVIYAAGIIFTKAEPVYSAVYGFLKKEEK